MREEIIQSRRRPYLKEEKDDGKLAMKRKRGNGEARELVR